MAWSEISVHDLAAWRQAGKEHTVVDVREDWELAEVSFPDVVHIRMQEIPQNLARIQAMAAPVVMLCHAGIRSAQCAAWLADQGVSEVLSLRDGVHVWAQEIDASIGFNERDRVTTL